MRRRETIRPPGGLYARAATVRRRRVAAKTVRLRDKEHCRFVTTQPCVVCGRTPSEAHHIRFAQPRALGRKVSDEYTIAVCRLHHRDLHGYGDEASWWAGQHRPLAHCDRPMGCRDCRTHRKRLCPSSCPMSSWGRSGQADLIQRRMCKTPAMFRSPRSEARLHDLVASLARSNSLSGRCSRRPHQYPACGGPGSGRTTPFSTPAFAILAHTRARA